ncbi:XK-related protein 4, partial [Ophiophagus hannah]
MPLSLSEANFSEMEEVKIYVSDQAMDYIRQFVVYEINVYTGTQSGAETNSNVYINIFGNQGDSGKRKLQKSSTNKITFQRNQTDVFSVMAVSLGALHKIVIGHDGIGPGSGWFLQKIVIRFQEEAESKEEVIEFLCNRWLDENQDDGKTERELIARKNSNASIVYPRGHWRVLVKTDHDSPEPRMSKRTLVIYGSKGKSDDLPLSSQSLGYVCFQPGATDEFIIESRDVGDIYKVRISCDDLVDFEGWHLKSLQMEELHASQEVNFECNCWFSLSQKCKDMVKEFPVVNENQKTLSVHKYVVSVHTGDLWGSETFANIYITVYGAQGDTGVRKLQDSFIEGEKFQRNKVDSFLIEAVSLSHLKKIVVGHDGEGYGAGIYLKMVTIKKSENSDKEWVFPCWNWLDTHMGICDTVCEIKTIDKKKQKTNVVVVILQVRMKDLHTKEELGFYPLNRWLFEEDGSETVTELAVVRPNEAPLKEITYSLSVYTGTLPASETDANIFITLFGTNGDSYKRQLKHSKSCPQFEKGQISTFAIQAVDLGMLSSVLVEHNNSGYGAGWYLDQILIQELGKSDSQYVFSCQQWLDSGVGDGKMKQELQLLGKTNKESLTKDVQGTWDVTVITREMSDNYGNSKLILTVCDDKGTSAAVFIPKGSFKTAKIYQTSLELDKKFNKICKIRLEIEDSDRETWHCHEVKLQNKKSKETLEIPCWRDFPDNKGCTVAEFPILITGTRFLTVKQYILYISTDSAPTSGTNSDVYVTLKGTMGDTGRRKLFRNGQECFSEGNMDVFPIEAVDIGKLYQLIVEKGKGSAWHLQKVMVKEPQCEGKETLFMTQTWLKDTLEKKKYASLTLNATEGLWKISCTTCREDSSKAFEESWENITKLIWVFYGDSGKSEPISLTSKTGIQADDKLTFDENLKQEPVYIFEVNETFHLDIDKPEIRKEIPLSLVTKEDNGSEHIIKVYTGDKRWSGTDANVHIILFGDMDTSHLIQLKNSLDHQDPFERGKRRYSLWDGLWILAAVAVYFADVGTDLWLAVDYYLRGQRWWFGLTLFFVLLGSLSVQVFSFRWFVHDFSNEDSASVAPASSSSAGHGESKLLVSSGSAAGDMDAGARPATPQRQASNASKGNATNSSNSSTTNATSTTSGGGGGGGCSGIRTPKTRSASCAFCIWLMQSLIHILQLGQIW